LRRHAGGDAHVLCVIAMDEGNHAGQRFAALVGVAGSTACVGWSGYFGERLAGAWCIDDEPPHDHARHLTQLQAAWRAQSCRAAVSHPSWCLWRSFVDPKRPANGIQVRLISPADAHEKTEQRSPILLTRVFIEAGKMIVSMP